MNGRTKAETITAWRRILTADLGDTITAKQAASIVGINQRSAREWLTRQIGPPTDTTDIGNVRAGLWNTAATRAAVQTMTGPGNRSTNRGRGTAGGTGAGGTGKH